MKKMFCDHKRLELESFIQNFNGEIRKDKFGLSENWLMLTYRVRVLTTCDGDKIVFRSQCRRVWRDIKWSPAV